MRKWEMNNVGEKKVIYFMNFHLLLYLNLLKTYWYGKSVDGKEMYYFLF